MTDLQVRRIPFTFDDDVPFRWHPTNPEFGLTMNAVSHFIIGFEQYIVDVMRDAMPLMTDPAVVEEAEAFLKQEAVHSRAHRAHIRALSTQYPGLQDALGDVLAAYRELYESRPLEFHLAYIADLEATFTPYFKMLLDHEDEFFAPGHEQVASLLLWHYTEEIEHRSSALMIFDHVVGKPWYRLRMLPDVLKHIASVLAITIEAFNEHVPFEDRGVDARCLLPDHALRRQFSGMLPFLAKDIDQSLPMAMEPVPPSEQRSAVARLIGSQRPGHDPTHQPLPSFAARWIARYDAGEDVTRWYSSQQEASS